MADMVVAMEVATAAVTVVDMVAKEATVVVEDMVVPCTVADTKVDQVVMVREADNKEVMAVDMVDTKVVDMEVVSAVQVAVEAAVAVVSAEVVAAEEVDAVVAMHHTEQHLNIHIKLFETMCPI